ncbi:hemolysin-III related-domain-containing protein, partial [Xylogone sp. PMI_703]
MPPRQRRPSIAEIILEDAKKLEKTVERALVVLWDDLPVWQQDNHYIRSGYRVASGSFKRSFASLGYLHNESVNIYTHLLGSLLFVFWTYWVYSVITPRYGSATRADILSFACFFAGAAFCMGMSATYHAISNHSPAVARFGNKLDYMGIVFLTTGSFIPIVYYGFYCHPHLQKLYWTMICSLGIGCIVVSIFDRFRRPAFRPYRAAMFVGL